MKDPERVEDCPEHIAEAIERATSYLKPLPNLEALQQNQMVQDAVVRNIEIIGEAAGNIQKMAPDFIAAHPDLPCPQMRAMRNVCHPRIFLCGCEHRLDDRKKSSAATETAER
jgi:uncharacterized protein with HEPN domain